MIFRFIKMNIFSLAAFIIITWKKIVDFGKNPNMQLPYYHYCPHLDFDRQARETAALRLALGIIIFGIK